MSKSPSELQKWQITLFSTVIFLIVVSPFTYNLTNSLFERILGTIAIDGCPTFTGLLLHTVVYILIVRYSMELNIV